MCLICIWVAACIGEGDGTPLQYFCLENPMDGGAWWAAVHGVTKSQTRLSDFTCHFSLSCTGEGNGNPLQCSCLENPRDGGARWAAVYGVAQSRTQLKWLSSSSSSCLYKFFHNDLIFWFVMRYVMSIFWKAFLGMTSFLVVDAFGSQLIVTNVPRTCYTNAVLPKRKLCVYF